MSINEAVKDRIIELCTKRKWTYHAVAGYAGIPSSTMTSIIDGTSKNPGIVTIKKICDGLEVTIVEFFDTSVFQNLEQEIK